MLESKKRIFKYFNILIIVVSLIYIIKNFVYYNIKVVNFNIKFNWLFIGIATALLLLVHIIYVIYWRINIKILGDLISFKKLSKVYFSTLLYKYIPGKIWVSLGRIANLRKESDKKTLIASLLIDLFFKLIAGSFIFFFCLSVFTRGSFRTFFKFDIPYYWIFVSIFIFLVFLFVLGYKKNLYSFREFFKKRKVGFLNTIKITIFLFILYSINICLEGFSFFLIANSVVKNANVFFLLGTKAITKSVFSLLPLNHLGPSEAIYIFFLKKIMTLPAFLIIPLIYRIWKIICEILLFFTFSGYDLLKKVRILKENNVV